MNKFSKKERISSVNEITQIISLGKAFKAFPFYIKVLSGSDDTIPLKVLITVPKRIHKKAVARNKIKRLIREAIRKNNKPIKDFLIQTHKNILLQINYISPEIMPYLILEKKLRDVLETVPSKI